MYGLQQEMDYSTGQTATLRISRHASVTRVPIFSFLTFDSMLNDSAVNFFSHIFEGSKVS
jgi:hypothetical protein